MVRVDDDFVDVVVGEQVVQRRLVLHATDEDGQRLQDLHVDLGRAPGLGPHDLEEQRQHVHLAEEVEEELAVVVPVHHHLRELS
jgi:hypothetical protein